jgi:predicted metal-dependent phosphoesterase TrpH
VDALLSNLGRSSRMTQRVSRADLHIHTMASDGTASVSQVLARAEEVGLDLIAITDHDRIDAAQAAQQMARSSGLHVQVVVGEEISTLQGHLLGLFLQERIRPLRSLRRTIAEIHEQGGLAILAHPLFPHPLCAQEGAIRSVAADRDPGCRPDGIETYNPTIFGTLPRRRVTRLTAELGLATLGNSDAHVLSAIGRVWTNFEGSSPEALRTAILDRTVSVGSGSDHTLSESPGIFGRQLLRNLIGLGQDLAGVTRPIWTLGGERRGRDLGYPGSRRRPARYVAEDER